MMSAEIEALKLACGAEIQVFLGSAEFFDLTGLQRALA